MRTSLQERATADMLDEISLDMGVVSFHENLYSKEIGLSYYRHELP